MKADLASYADRGTGYNYYDGSAWGPAPAARIETQKTGWPNLNKFNGDGELVLSHNSTSNLVFYTRPAKGTGAWTQNLGPTGPIGSTGTAVNLLWPRAITNGTNHQNIHVIVLTMPTANGGIVYKGMDGALIYYRSLDGGATWDKQAVALPTIDSLHFDGFGGDDYSWIEPHGDTIAFLHGNTWNGTWLMKSFDNGNTWTRQDILTPYYAKSPSTDTIHRFYGCDGTMAGAMDKHGVFHVAFGRMFAAQGLDNTPPVWGTWWNAGTDGLVYWNSTMPALDTAMMVNLDSIDAHHKLIGYVAANAAGDSIIGFPYYKGSLSTYPNVTINENGDIFFLWTSLTVGNPDPTPYNYRHIWGRGWLHGETYWSEMQDFNADIFYFGMEFAYPEVGKELIGNNLLLLTQTSTQPGSNVAAGTTYPAVPVHEVTFQFREIPTHLLVGVQPKPAINNFYVGQNYPNPANGTTSFVVNVDKTANVTVEVSNIVGQKLMILDKGVVNAGAQKFTIDCSSLTSGVYFYTVKQGEKSVTKKMIVQ
jgi:hypothetical protein